MYLVKYFSTTGIVICEQQVDCDSKEDAESRVLAQLNRGEISVVSDKGNTLTVFKTEYIGGYQITEKKTARAIAKPF